MTKQIAVFGAGGFAREVLQIILDINQSERTWEPVCFVVDAQSDTSTVHGLPVVGPAWLNDHPDVHIVIAVGSSVARNKIATKLENASSNPFAKLIHPKAWLGRQIEIGEGSVICAGAMLTTDIVIGRHVHINIGSTVGHDAVLRDFVTINPGVNVSGNVTLGKGVEVGTGSILIPHAHVGEWSALGAGSVATKPIPANVTVVGAPAKIIKTRTEGWHEG